MLVRDHCRKALECARSKRFDEATQQYIFSHDEALDHVRESLKQKYGQSEIKYFEKQIDRFMEEIVEDPARTIIRKFLPDSQLESQIRKALEPNPTEETLLDMPERLLFEIKRKQETLKRIDEKRFHEGHIQTVAVPDGEGSYFLDTVGTPGRWEVFFTTGDLDRTAPASAARLLDALCDISFNNGIPQEFGQLERGFTGEDDQLVIIDDIGKIDMYVEDGSLLYRPSDAAFSDSITVERLNSGQLRLYVPNSLLMLSRTGLRSFLRDTFPSLVLTVSKAETHKSLAPRNEEIPPDETPGVVMIDFSGTSGPYLVGHALEMKGIPTQIIKPGEKITLSRPCIFCVSIATQPFGLSEVGNHLAALRKSIDEHNPGSFIIVGGPTAKYAKTVIALYPEINIALRGDGEEVLPEIIRIIGQTKTTDGLSRKQIAELKKIDGLFLHTPGFVMVNNLNKVNTVEDFNLPVIFHYGTFSMLGGGKPILSKTIINPDVARGCPFRCNFCNMAMGWKQRYADFEKLQKYVLGMLAIEMPVPYGTEKSIAAALQTNSSSTAEPQDEWFPAGVLEFHGYQLAEVIRILDRDLSTYLSEKSLIAQDTFLLTDDAVMELAQIFGVKFEDVKKTAKSMKTGVLDALTCHLPVTITRSQINEVIVLARRRWMTVLLEKGENLYDHGLILKLEIMLEDDNTLCNREYIETFCRWIIGVGLQDYFRFHAGQTSVNTLLKKGKPNEDFIHLLHEAGCCEVEMGVDGLSNNIMKQNNKHGYGLSDAIKVVLMLEKWGIHGASNRLYSAPYASKIDVVESLLLGALAPLGGRSLGAPFIFTVPGSQYTNEFTVNYPDRAANKTAFAQTYDDNYEYAWSQFPEYVPLEHNLYPYMADARVITQNFEPVITVQRSDKYIYDSERKMGEMTHELGILGKLETEGLEDEIKEVILRWQASDQPDPELKALGEIIRTRRSEGIDDFAIFRWILTDTYNLEAPKSFSDILNFM